MRRIILVLTVAALMAATMASAGPAKAQSGGNTDDYSNQDFLVIYGDNWWDDGYYWDDGYWWDDGVSFSIGDSVNESGGISFS